MIKPPPIKIPVRFLNLCIPILLCVLIDVNLFPGFLANLPGSDQRLSNTCLETVKK
jgi:hypothetical protein